MQTYGHVQIEKKKESRTNFLSFHILIVSNLDKTLYTPSDFRRWHFAQLGPNRSVRIIFQCLRQAGSIGGIQNLRKESGLNVTDRIKLTVSGDDELKSAFQMFETFVAGEVLASSSVFADNIASGTEVESEDKKWSISIEKA